MSQAQGSESRIIMATEATFKSSPESVIHACEAAWDELVDADVTASADTTAGCFKVGSKSAKFVIATNLSAGDIIATDDFTAKDLSSYTHIVAWVKSSVALSAGDIQILLDNTAQCASPVESLDVPALAANTMTQIKIALAAAASCTAIVSVGLKAIVDKGAMSFWIDDIRAINQAIVCPFKSESMRLSRNLNSSATIRNSRNPSKPARGSYEVGGDLSFEAHPFIQRLLHYALGSVVSTNNSTYYEHVFKIGSLPSFVYEKGFTDLDKYFVYNGCKIGSLKMSGKADGFIDGSISIMGAKETIKTVSFDDNGIDDAFTPFDAYEAVISESVTPLGTVTEWDFNIDNSLDGGSYVIDGTGERYSLPARRAKVTGKITCLFEDTTMYDKAIANTETALNIVLTKGTGAGTAGNEKLSIYFDELILKPSSPVIGGDQGVVVDFDFEAYYENDADASAARMVLLNTQALA
jgi:hypothetical protein